MTNQNTVIFAAFFQSTLRLITADEHFLQAVWECQCTVEVSKVNGTTLQR